MSEITKLESWVKTHKAASAAIAGGVGFIYLQRKGSSSTTDTTSSDTVGTLAAPIDNSSLQDTSPLDEAVTNAQQSSDNAAEQAQLVSDALTSLEGAIQDNGSATDPGTTNDTSPPDNTDTGSVGAGPAPSEPAPALAVTQGSGITLAGHHFSGATGSQIVGAGSNSNGHYTTYLVMYPSRTERWNHYTSGKKAGSWVGPFGGNVTSSAPANSSAPTPTSSVPKVTSGTPQQTTVTTAPKQSGPTIPSGWDKGNDISGRTFAGAIAHHVYDRGSNSNGSYTGHEILFSSGSTQKWHHYTSGKAAGKWIQA